MDYIETRIKQLESQLNDPEIADKLRIEIKLEAYKECRQANSSNVIHDVSGLLPSEKDVNNWSLPKGEFYSFRREGANWCKNFILDKLNSNNR